MKSSEILDIKEGISGKKEQSSTNKTKSKTVGLNIFMLTITLNLSRLNIPIRRQKLSDKKQKQQGVCKRNSLYVETPRWVKSISMGKDIPD